MMMIMMMMIMMIMMMMIMMMMIMMMIMMMMIMMMMMTVSCRRYERLQMRNNLDMEGYRCELNQLRTRLQQVEKLYKAFMFYRKTKEINTATDDRDDNDDKYMSKNSSRSNMDGSNDEYDVTTDIDEC